MTKVFDPKEKFYLDNKGFTLIELIIVLAIMTILGAIAVPNFSNTSAKARLKADIQSARVIDNAKDLYENETGIVLNDTPVNVVKKLVSEGYLKREYLPQTDKAEWKLEDSQFKVGINSCDESVKAVYTKLNDEEKSYVQE